MGEPQRNKGRQRHLSLVRGTGPGAYARGGPGSVPLRRGLLGPPEADPEGPTHLARFDVYAVKVWLYLLLMRDHRNGLAVGDHRDIVNGTGLPAWRVTKALRWLHENPPAAPYIETARPAGRGRPPLYRILRDESLRDAEEGEDPDA